MNTTDQDTPDTDAPEDDVLEDEEPEDVKPFRVRDVFQFRRPRATEPDDEEEAETPPLPAVPPMPSAPPAIPAQTAGTGSDRLPKWWEPKKELGPVACTHPNPLTYRVPGQAEPVPHYCPDCNTDLPYAPAAAPEPIAVSKTEDDHEDADDADEGEEGEEGEESEEHSAEGEEAPDPPRPLRTRLLYGKDPKKQYARPVYAKPPAPKTSALKWWSSISGTSRHGLYNGTALAAGWWAGIPQWVTAEVAYLAATYDSWTAFYVCIWYVVAAIVVLFDRATRRLLPPVALVCRIPLVSMIVGVLLYGNPAA